MPELSNEEGVGVCQVDKGGEAFQAEAVHGPRQAWEGMLGAGCHQGAGMEKGVDY
jgi:hypothetical protein